MTNKYTRKKVDIDKAKELYESGMTQIEVAKELGTTQRVICMRFKQVGYKCRIAKKRNQFGKNNDSWKGGMVKSSFGYIMVTLPKHPSANREGYVFEHRLNMEKKIGRYLSPKEIVHHINEIKTDNRIDNLQLLKNVGEHNKIHKQDFSKRKRGKTGKFIEW